MEVIFSILQSGNGDVTSLNAIMLIKTVKLKWTQKKIMYIVKTSFHEPNFGQAF